MKVLIGIFILLAAACIVFIKFAGDCELKKVKNLRSNPAKYSYFQQSTGVSISLSSNEIDCMEKIKEYYNLIRNGNETYLPSCFEHGIPVNDSVYVLEANSDNQFVLISSFYRSHNGKEKYFIGYVLKETLHDKPYVKNEEP